MIIVKDFIPVGVPNRTKYYSYRIDEEGTIKKIIINIFKTHPGYYVSDFIMVDMYIDDKIVARLKYEIIPTLPDPVFSAGPIIFNTKIKINKDSLLKFVIKSGPISSPTYDKYPIFRISLVIENE